MAGRGSGAGGERRVDGETEEQNRGVEEGQTGQVRVDGGAHLRSREDDEGHQIRHDPRHRDYRQQDDLEPPAVRPYLATTGASEEDPNMELESYPRFHSVLRIRVLQFLGAPVFDPS